MAKKGPKPGERPPERSEAFKRKVVKEIDSGAISEHAACRKYKVGHGSVGRWRKELGFPTPPKEERLATAKKAAAAEALERVSKQIVVATPVPEPDPVPQRLRDAVETLVDSRRLGDSKRRIKGISSGLTREQKEQAVAEFNAGERAQEVAKRYGVTATALYWWRKQMSMGWTVGDPYKAARHGYKPRRSKQNGADAEDGRAVVPVKTSRTRGPVVAVVSHQVRDATVLLRRVERSMMKEIRDGHVDRLSHAQTLTLLALQALQGEAD